MTTHLDAADAEIDQLLSFWFGTLDADGGADREHQTRWFTRDEAFDLELRARFGALHAAVAAGERDGWLATDRGVLAHVIALDQLSRNLFRGTPGMFAADARALAVADRALDAGVDRRLAVAERGFLYMPFMHAESLDAQERCVRLFQALRDGAPASLRPAAEESVKYAIAHRDIVARFGRFPHRNAILGRSSTAEELTFLQQPGSSF